MLKVGITGGIGSGKSTVAKVFETLGIPVYNADAAAKRLMVENNSLKESVIGLFGKESYTVEGELNRKHIADIVFTQPEKLKQLNEIIHPATIKDAAEWMERQQTPYAIKEAALFFESGAHASVDVIIGVFAPTPLRIQRAMQRDNISREEVMNRMNKQMDEEIKMRLCDYVITNDDRNAIIPQVLELHQKFIEKK